jgi:hypothetical protein
MTGVRVVAVAAADAGNEAIAIAVNAAAHDKHTTASAVESASEIRTGRRFISKITSATHRSRIDHLETITAAATAPPLVAGA